MTHRKWQPINMCVDNLLTIQGRNTDKHSSIVSQYLYFDWGELYCVLCCVYCFVGGDALVYLLLLRTDSKIIYIKGGPNHS